MSHNFELLNQIEADLGVAPGIHSGRTTTGWSNAASREPLRDDVLSRELLSLAQNVFLSNREDTPRVVVLCGIDKESGSSQICMRLGSILAGSNRRSVCLIDANLRSPRLSQRSLEDRHTPAPVPGSGVFSLGNNLSLAYPQLLDSKQGRVLAPAQDLKRQLLQLRQSFEFILIDAPGANAGADAIVLSQIADAAILVIEANSTRKAAALKAKKAMDDAGVQLLGVVLNNRSFPIPEQLYRRL
jgi:Mrp family chromosome partitioning ATPase